MPSCRGRFARPGRASSRETSCGSWKARAPSTARRLEPLHEVVERLGPAWASEPDPEAQAALARALEVTHKNLHRLLKPDETAEGRAVANARRKDPAADENAQSIVIHPLHRAGAPGDAGHDRDHGRPGPRRPEREG